MRHVDSPFCELGFVPWCSKSTTAIPLRHDCPACLARSVLDRIDPHLRALACTSWNSQEKTVHALSLPSKISSGASAQRRLNLREQLVMVRIFHLKNVNEALPSRHINTLMLGIVVKIIRVGDAGQHGD